MMVSFPFGIFESGDCLTQTWGGSCGLGPLGGRGAVAANSASVEPPALLSSQCCVSSFTCRKSFASINNFKKRFQRSLQSWSRGEAFPRLGSPDGQQSVLCPLCRSLRGEPEPRAVELLQWGWIELRCTAHVNPSLALKT